MQAYKDSVNNVLFSGPTLFAPLLQYVTQKIKDKQQHVSDSSSSSSSSSIEDNNYQNKYTILLIITDGVINDLNETKEIIIQASKLLPLSIIIIGVGNADFTSMNILDSDKQPLTSNDGNKANRDIVQFVALHDQSDQVLAQQVLEEIPSQVVSYMEQHNIWPKSK